MYLTRDPQQSPVSDWDRTFICGSQRHTAIKKQPESSRFSSRVPTLLWWQCGWEIEKEEPQGAVWKVLMLPLSKILPGSFSYLREKTLREQRAPRTWNPKYFLFLWTMTSRFWELDKYEVKRWEWGKVAEMLRRGQSYQFQWETDYQTIYSQRALKYLYLYLQNKTQMPKQGPSSLALSRFFSCTFRYILLYTLRDSHTWLFASRLADIYWAPTTSKAVGK